MKKNKNLLKHLSFFVAFTLFLSLFPVIKGNALANGLPAKPVLAANQYGTDYDGDYDISINLYYGNNATSYKLYEGLGISTNYKVVGEGTLVDGTPGTQSATVQIRGRKSIGMYNYYAEFINSYGSTKSDILQVRVGKDGSTPILIDPIDNDGVKLQHTIAQGNSSYKIASLKNTSPDFSVISSNTTVAKASIVNGTTLVIEGIADGRAGIKITDNKTGDIRQIGFRVRKKDGSLPGMPNYLSIGQVSEDTDNDLNFWKDVSYTDTNKRVDVRYIYINGGPFKGWRSWTTEDGDRAKNYIRESLKLGMIPYFVYYNIPDSDENYAVDIAHINDKAYLEGYYKDLKFFLDICKEYAGDETVGIVLEPDFLGYMMQQSNKTPSEISAVVDSVYSSGVLEKGKDPNFENNVKGLVESINYTIRKYHKPAYFGWQFNIWSYDSHEVPGQGILHKTEFIGWDAGRQFIKQVATQTANYYMSAGITSYGADFISIDKYGLDGAYESQYVNDPKQSKWLWNADIWNNYLLYTKTLHEVTKKPVILWQLPVGHLNSSQEANPYNGNKFPDLTNAVNKYEDSAPTYFFGDTFKPGAGNRLNYFGDNLAKDPKIKVNGDTVTWGDHMSEAKDAGVISMLFGAGVNGSTDAVGSPPTDDYWWITKAQRYYKNPIQLDVGTVIDPTLLPLAPSITTNSNPSNGNYTITVNIPANSKGTSYKLYENGMEVKSGTVTTSALVSNYIVENKPTGTYLYKAEIINSYGIKESQILSQTVNNNTTPPVKVPLKGTITVDKASNDGNYNLTLSIPINSLATTYNLYENNAIVKTGSVTSAAATIKVPFANKLTGSYTYKLDLVNSDGTTSSDNLIVTCTALPSSRVVVDFAITSDWGSGANYQIVITNNTNADILNWKLSFDFDKQINSMDNGTYSQSGKTYSIIPKSWNTTIKKGEKLVLSGGCVGGVGNITLQNINVTYDGSDVPSIIGDVNGDKVVNATDLSLVATAYNSKIGEVNYNASYDLNSDGIIDIYDLVFVASKIK